jgi:hypothetical protein
MCYVLIYIWHNIIMYSSCYKRINPLSATYFYWRVPGDFWRNLYIDRSVTSRIETIVWRYIAAICVGVQYGYTKRFNWMRYSVKININRSFIGRSSRNLKILMFQNSYFHFFSVKVYCSFERNIFMIVCVYNAV